MMLLTLIAAATGVALTIVQAVLTVLFRARQRFFVLGLRRQASPSSFRPDVSILTPLCGLEDDLHGNLESLVRQRGVDFEVILSAADPDDPAVAVARRMIDADPHFRLVIGGDAALERGNRKVARLIAAAGQARGDIVMISDSNARLGPDDVARMAAIFRDPDVGCVSNLFTGAGAQSFGASIESLHLLSFVVPGNVLAAFAHVPCVVGKSMAISRSALEAIGGFERFAGVLAEDQAIGLAVRDAGFRVVLSPVVVRNVVVRRSLRRALARQVRWDKIRFAFSKWMYSAEFLLNPLPFALAAVALGAPWMIAVATGILRVVSVALLARATEAPIRLRELLLVPLLDLLQFGAQFIPYMDDRVTWRGHTARIGRHSVLMHVTETHSAAA